MAEDHHIDSFVLEAVTRRWSVKIVFLKSFQNSQENNCVRVSFLIKFQASAYNFIKKETLTHFFSCEFCKIFKNTVFLRTPLVTASVISQPTQRHRKNVVKTSCFWSERCLRLVWNGSRDDLFFKMSPRLLLEDILKNSSKTS